MRMRTLCLGFAAVAIAFMAPTPPALADGCGQYAATPSIASTDTGVAPALSGQVLGARIGIDTVVIAREGWHNPPTRGVEGVQLLYPDTGEGWQRLARGDDTHLLGGPKTGKPGEGGGTTLAECAGLGMPCIKAPEVAALPEVISADFVG